MYSEASAKKPSLLWLDLTQDHSVEELVEHFRSDCDCILVKTAKPTDFDFARKPDMICLHYDCPDMHGLSLLLEIKQAAPSIPITMFTVQHSEELVIWAMRSRVWEYVVLPLTTTVKSRFLNSLAHLYELRRNSIRANKTLIEHGPSLPDSIRLTAEYRKHKALGKVLLYIDQHFRESIDQKELASRFGTTAFRFSRLFKEVNGLRFMDYVLNKRMECAKDLLDNSQMSIISIGYQVGFMDPSYFARAFKQVAGCSPSKYRQIRREPVPATVEKQLDQALLDVIESLPLASTGRSF